MEDKRKNEETFFNEWLELEIWFMRVVGAAVLLIAGLNAVSGTLRTTGSDTTIVINAFNNVISIMLVGAGAWALWYSFQRQRMEELVAKFIDTSPNRSIIFGAIQGIIGVLFFISGITDAAITIIVLGALMLSTGAWFLFRSTRITKYREAFFE